MNSLAACLCEHAAVLHEDFSLENDVAGECLVCKKGKLPCYKFNWNEEHFINQLIRQMEKEKGINND
jgi:hypothetical protein